MSAIYITYRPEDTSRQELDVIVQFLSARYRHVTIIRTQAYSTANILAVQDAVRGSVMLVNIIGRRWHSLVNVDGESLLHNPNDYLNHELTAAIESPTTTIINIVVDNAASPQAKLLPRKLRAITKARSFRNQRLDTLTTDLQQ